MKGIKTIMCRKCKTVVPIDTKKCPNCGTEIVGPVAKIITVVVGLLIIGFIINILYKHPDPTTSSSNNTKTELTPTVSATPTESQSVSEPKSNYTVEVKHEETNDNYSYVDSEGKEIKGTFYFQEILIKGSIGKEDALKLARKIEASKGSVETRVKMYKEYDDNKVLQSKDNLIEDIILRNGKITISDPSSVGVKYVTDDEFLGK